MYFHSNEYLPKELLTEVQSRQKMLSIVGGADIALILAGLHKVKELTLCDLDDKQFEVFRSKKEFIENDFLGLDYLLFYYYPSKNNDDRNEFSRFSKFLPETQDFVRKNLEEIIKSKNQLYPLFLKDYVEAFFSADNLIYEHLSGTDIKVSYLQEDIFNCFSDEYDVVYLSNAIDFMHPEDIPQIIEKVEVLKDDVVIYDSTKYLSEVTVPHVQRYSKQGLIKVLKSKYHNWSFYSSFLGLKKV